VSLYQLVKDIAYYMHELRLELILVGKGYCIFYA